MAYEDQLIQESTGEGMPSFREMHEDYYHEDEDVGGNVIPDRVAANNYFHSETVGRSVEDVCVPASAESHDNFGAESNPYTKEESDERWKETHIED